ncbi:MAG: putative beta-lysine N-acetyltransferase [Ectobacillus sp.]
MNYSRNLLERNSQYVLEGVLDHFNERIRIDYYNGDVKAIIERTEELARQNNFTKIIIKGKREDFSLVFSFGYLLEAVIPGYFYGHDAYIVTKYKDVSRRNSSFWLHEDNILQDVKEKVYTDKKIPEQFTFRKATMQDAKELANLFGKVFQVYPTPLDNHEYIVKTMKEDTIYYVYEVNGNIVSTASAEIERRFANAELTNCATLPEFRQHGLMKQLLQRLEEELRSQSIFCSYTLARALSFGMNAAFYQLGYTYTGRMANNCYIFDKMEDMNVWVKDLSCS